MKYCKNCGKELKEGAKFCPSCGSAVSAQNNAPGFEKTGAGKIQSGLDAVKTSRQDSLNPSQAFCKNCGAPLKEGAKFCPKCGSLIDEIARRPRSRRKTRRVQRGPSAVA